MANQFDGSILHFTGIRIRVTGIGNLRSQIQSLDNVQNTTLTPVVMALATSVEPFVISNFNQQRGRVKFLTTSIDEIFNLSKYTVYVRQFGTGYPQ